VRFFSHFHSFLLKKFNLLPASGIVISSFPHNSFISPHLLPAEGWDQRFLRQL
jgi:hypothetical protein